METNLIQVRESDNVEAAIDQAVEVLNRGGLVGFPTETVYGLAARVDSDGGLAKLCKIKQRPVNKPFTLHIGDKSVLDYFVPKLDLRDRAFLRKTWPGPLTVVFELTSEQLEIVRNKYPDDIREKIYHNNSIGVRLPDNDIALKLLSAVDGPVVASSANIAGAAPPTQADEIMTQLDGRIEMVLDDGPTRYVRSSTIVKISDKKLEVIRQGILDAESLERMRKVTILFVCTGNTCRSAMAEGICRKELAKKLSCPVDQLGQKGYNITSSGVMAFDGVGATPEAINVCRDLGVNIRAHRARLLGIDLINQADYIFAMADSHYRAVVEMVPQAADKTLPLAGDIDIADPIGGSLADYRGCANLIAKGVREQLEGKFIL